MYVHCLLGIATGLHPISFLTLMESSFPTCLVPGSNYISTTMVEIQIAPRARGTSTSWVVVVASSAQQFSFVSL